MKTMTTLRCLLLALLLLPTVNADEIVVITGLQTPLKNASIKQLKNIFLRKSLLSESRLRWIPLNLKPDDPLRVAFSKSLLNRDPDDLEAYWNEQYFQGITPPYVVSSEEAMLRFVSNTPGAIGYIAPCHLDKRVQEVFRLNSPLSFKQRCERVEP
jgi:ABC-type phosphate transport system substrate-binding protein